MSPEQETIAASDLHSIARSLESIADSLKKIADCFAITGVVPIHSPPSQENSMPSIKGLKAGAKRGTGPLKKGAFAAVIAPVGQGGDTVTINGTDVAGDILPLPPTVSLSAPVVSDPTVLTVGTVTGVSYPETFLKAGQVTVTSTATWSDGSDGPFTIVDTVTLTPAPPPAITGLVAVHSQVITPA